MTNRRIPDTSCLYAILDTAWLDGRDPAVVAGEMIAGGVDIIQLRAKDMPLRKIAAMARRVLEITRAASIPFIINDHSLIAAGVDADGVHLGQEDMSLSEARKIMGSGKWIGKSTHSLQQALAAEEEGADYIGAGPVFATPTKPDVAPIGLDAVRTVAARVRIPFFCIGGIKLENVGEILSAGARRVAVVSGILRAPSVTGYCRELKKLLKDQV